MLTDNRSRGVHDVFSSSGIGDTHLQRSEQSSNARLQQSARTLGSDAAKDVAGSDGADVRFTLGQSSEASTGKKG